MLLTRIWNKQPGRFFCISTKSGTGRWHDEFFGRHDMTRLRAYIEANNDKDVYFCPHGFREARRLKEHAVLPSLLWADLDEADPRNMTPRPTMAWESSPGRYVGIWLTDRVVDEDLNRRLTYHVGADRGGWDLTQVLRVPGTRNFKYASSPRVRLLWSDGERYRLRDLERTVPETREDRSHATNAEEVYRSYEGRLSPFLRRELLAGKPVAGKRSEMIWRINKELLEAGMSRDEAFALLRVSPWNKFKDRRDGDDQLRRELDKSVGEKMKVGARVEQTEYCFLARPMSEVKEETIDWVWYPYLARGELTILEGDPGVGKSYMAQMVAAALVDGKELPSPRRVPIEAGRVAYFDIENSAATVTRQRLVTNGCSNLAGYYQEEEPFTIDDDPTLERVFDAIDKLRPTLVVFDTINTYIGKADIYKSSEVQGAFKRFREIAQRYDCAVLVLRHLTKSTREKALYRGQGSIAFSGLARVVMTVGLHPEDPETRVMAVTKLNITRSPKALTFTIDALPDTLKQQDRSKFRWGEYVDLSSDEIVTVPVEKGGSSNEAAETLLKELLASGPMLVTDIERAAEARGISRRKMYRARDTLEVVASREGFGGKSTWRAHS